MSIKQCNAHFDFYCKVIHLREFTHNKQKQAAKKNVSNKVEESIEKKNENQEKENK